ncbi:mechanosensitive ion channel family protein [Thiomicrorhabdus arctica]|jgi:small-conductance mechanosensitive channel|uniref:mechanosensitive ion channel family protein n=1 Tax=Thiomicrorhabdus arctica TaxID=131540 RepID=UPI0003827A9E|nr:mechanosensitive ion channel family protein [Thiomicrorhabdus arctica]
MIDSFQLEALFYSDNPMIAAFTTLSLALMIAVIVNYSIKWIPLVWAHKRRRVALAFSLNTIRFPISATIILIGVNTVLGSWDLPNTLEHSLPGLVTTINIIVWGQFLYRASQYSLKNLSQQYIEGSLIRPQTLPLLDNVSAVLIILVILYLLFITWNIDMTAWLASAGIIGIAIGFAAKDSIANLLSGVFILADSPYKINDYIVIDSGERGKVTHIGLRSTRILTRDDLEINIPNAIIANGKIVNESSGRHIKSRTRIAVSVAYGSDIDQVKALLMDEAVKESQICDDPEPRVRFRSFGASGLELELLVWIDDPEIRGRVRDSLNSSIYKRFAIEGVEIPYSKHDLYIKSLPTTEA